MLSNRTKYSQEMREQTAKFIIIRIKETNNKENNK
jgi:hypothetical protein